jgi:hypothetical protein
MTRERVGHGAERREKARRRPNGSTEEEWERWKDRSISLNEREGEREGERKRGDKTRLRRENEKTEIEQAVILAVKEKDRKRSVLRFIALLRSLYHAMLLLRTTPSCLCATHARPTLLLINNALCGPHYKIPSISVTVVVVADDVYSISNTTAAELRQVTMDMRYLSYRTDMWCCDLSYAYICNIYIYIYVFFVGLRRRNA